MLKTKECQYFRIYLRKYGREINGGNKKDGRFICTVQKVVRLHCLPVVYMRSTWWSPTGDN